MKKKITNVFSLFCQSFFHVLRNNFFFGANSFLFTSGVLVNQLFREFSEDPKKINAFQVFYRKMNAFGFSKVAFFHQTLLIYHHFFIKRSQYIMKLMQKKIISKHNAIEHWRGCSFSGVGKKKNRP